MVQGHLASLAAFFSAHPGQVASVPLGQKAQEPNAKYSGSSKIPETVYVHDHKYHKYLCVFNVNVFSSSRAREARFFFCFSAAFGCSQKKGEVHIDSGIAQLELLSSARARHSASDPGTGSARYDHLSRIEQCGRTLPQASFVDFDVNLFLG